MLIGGTVGVRLLRWLAPPGHKGYLDGRAYAHTSKLLVLLGPGLYDAIRGKTVIDFGCGPGDETIEMARMGAKRVIGVDIRPDFLERGRAAAEAAGVGDRCTFVTSPAEPADIIVSLDSFEHFDDPAAILRVMDGYLASTGKALVSFGPTWFHPLGGHLFSVFPWAHLLFTERALLAWRKTMYPKQTARTITECGLNKMTIRRFERLIADSPFEFERFEARPIRRLTWLSRLGMREMSTAIVRCTLVKRAARAGAAT